MKNFIIFCLLFLFSCSFVIFAHAQKLKTVNTPAFIMNKEPLYKNSEYVTLQKLYSIDLEKTDDYFFGDIPANMEADDKNNLYILDYVTSKIAIFDSSGKFLKLLGGKGQAPKELEKPVSMSIDRNKIYIYERNKGIKIWDLNGKYINFKVFPYTIFKFKKINK